jgi:hypothetical protein
MFGLLNKDKIELDVHKKKLYQKFLIAESHGWLIDTIIDEGWDFTYNMYKNLPVKQWVKTFEGAKPEWSVIHLTLQIKDEAVLITPLNVLLPDIKEIVFYKRFSGISLKEYEDKIISNAEGVDVYEILKKHLTNYKVYLKNNSYPPHIGGEIQTEMFDFIESKKL